MTPPTIPPRSGTIDALDAAEATIRRLREHLEGEVSHYYTEAVRMREERDAARAERDAVEDDRLAISRICDRQTAELAQLPIELAAIWNIPPEQLRVTLLELDRMGTE